MSNRTDNIISSKNRKKGIVRNILLVFNILLLAAAVVIAAMVLTGCSKEPETYPEAEALVKSELENIKTSGTDSELIKSLTEQVSGEFDGSMLEGYVDKLKDFDYEIIGTTKVKSEDKSKDEEGTTVAVTTRITTYDFANEFLKAWNEHMSMDETKRWGNQFYSFLLLRLSSVSSKDYVSDVDIICTDEKGDGNWKAEIKENEELMNVISGGMLNEIKKLVTDDAIIDESELYEDQEG